MKIDGRLIAENILEGLKSRVEVLRKKGVIPTFLVILVGDNENSIAYINHKKIKDFQNLAIKPYDSLVILIGTNDIERALSNTVSINHIKEAEKRSEGC